MFFVGLLNDSQRSDRNESTFPSNGDTDTFLEGYHDENFYKKLRPIFQIPLQQAVIVEFVLHP